MLLRRKRRYCLIDNDEDRGVDEHERDFVRCQNNHARREDLSERQAPLDQPSLYSWRPDFAAEF